MNKIKILKLKNFPILKQLQLEEALYRTPNTGNWIILNEGTPEPIVIVGVSGKADKLVNLKQTKERNIQTMRRFSGGGTVVADENTIFSSILLEFNSFKQFYPHMKSFYPKDIMKWSAEHFYNKVFIPHQDFSLQEHDYAFGERKFGGNAQSFCKEKFLHHTSFLWDFKDDNMMSCLKQPEKIPEYRQNRDHLSFLCKLKDRYHTKDQVFNNFIQTINNIPSLHSIEEVSLKDAESFLQNNHFKANQIYNYNLNVWENIKNDYNNI
ncbi:hypothetical protein DICPUDRAFT_34335 [Dictyostelium purpureum]|uniref:BPL/LPL catalytic domain-containing protein n=1 Tax=Dictyostelium purpureum TaxID=5786 RepID=F0ZMG9_DICPU|nr:uncharacterized protein DICPUDRAFT_34335 [Dictyostelium purpureum]EGC34864.1 hypothetical protein DICPUDRAFT_34335 [Dictyostelium purpureum]|eukprot:XP_003288618.1 hypothetical protein DICPUDRAFT_34335 [Dictyostelium purpureum]